MTGTEANRLPTSRVMPIVSRLRSPVFGVRPVATSSLSARTWPRLVTSKNSPPSYDTWVAWV